MDYTAHGILQARILGVGSLSLLQGIFPIKRSNLGLQHYGWILYQLSHKGRQRILGWIAYHFSMGYSQPRNQTEVSCIAGGFFTNWAIREAKNLALVVCFLLPLKRKREKMSDICSLFPPFGDPSLPACYPPIPPLSFRRIMLPRERGIIFIPELLPSWQASSLVYLLVNDWSSALPAIQEASTRGWYPIFADSTIIV